MAFGNSTGEVAEISLGIQDFQDTTKYTNVRIGYECFNAAAQAASANGSGTWRNAAAVSNLTLLPESGTYSGEITILGIPHA